MATVAGRGLGVARPAVKNNRRNYITAEEVEMVFQKATKMQSKLRCAIFGPSGSGKTYSALRIATGMGGKIALIDTERGSASKYADRFDFDVSELLESTVDNLVDMIGQAKGYDVLIIDSLSHSWQELLVEVDALAKAKYKGNSWSAWSEGTPKQRSLVNAILSFDGHIIASMRSKTEWQTESGNNGKSRPVRVGLAPEQGKGIEYEFDLLLEISPEHYANVIKDRTGKYQDKIIEKPGEDFGRELIEWLKDGKSFADVRKEKVQRVIDLVNTKDYNEQQFWGYFGKDQVSDFTDDQLNYAIANLSKRPDKKAAVSQPPPAPPAAEGVTANAAN
ncbi:putative AAA family ATPase [Candidatus Termititenax aidoneus]|uniref:AAA family ATPase n=1 Tax=Termititenax aidoneus TaxID=2218524 RepID=A0A388TC02_TERA1|nr:putative AAA family ATPase [Candidatus Termititenax aidoneus]